MLHIDGSRHAWLALRPEQKQTLITVIDDATSRLLCAQLWPQERIQAVLAALREVVEVDGIRASIYTDGTGWAFQKPKAGAVVSKTHLTQVGQVLKRLGIENIPSYSTWTPSDGAGAHSSHRPLLQVSRREADDSLVSCQQHSRRTRGATAAGRERPAWSSRSRGPGRPSGSAHALATSASPVVWYRPLMKGFWERLRKERHEELTNRIENGDEDLGALLFEIANRGDDPSLVDQVLSRGAAVDYSGDRLGRSPLHGAANGSYHYEGSDEVYLELAKRLLAAGANIEARDKDGSTPLHSAAGGSYP
jgi:hypothetical protein